MASVNRVILIGHLGKDPEVRTFQNGNRVCSFSVATGERWKDKTTGDYKERTEWHRVSIFNDRLVEIAEKYLHKGSKVYLEGQLETRKWTDKDGVEKYATEVVLRQFRGEIVLLDKAAAAPDEREPATASAAPARAPFDDDIPF